MRTYNWVTIGCGWIATEMAEAMQRQGRTFYGAATRTPAHAAAFAETYHIPKVYETIDDVFADEAVDIVYLATPHNTHMEYLRKALCAGKHVLCEKSITLNTDELEQAVALAEQQHVVLAEAMTLYHMPVCREIKRRIDSGEFGPLRIAQVHFGSYKPYDMDNRFFNKALAGGALLDIGVYALSFVRWFLSSCPTEVTSQVRFAPSGADEQAGILLKNAQEEMAAVTLSLHAKQPKRGMLSLDRACIELTDYPRGQEAVITYTADGHRETVTCGDTACALDYEIRDMEAAVSGEQTEMYLGYTRDVMHLMTDLRRDWGLRYAEETAP